MDEKEWQEAIESFLENPFWAGYYDAAPSGAKEIISLGFYMSSSERAHRDPAAQSALEECREALEKEDIDYLAQHSPNPYERAFYRKIRAFSSCDMSCDGNARRFFDILFDQLWKLKQR